MGQLVGYRSTAVMPHNSPVRTAQGQVQRGKALAQASASLEACRQLHQVHDLSCYTATRSINQLFFTVVEINSGPTGKNAIQ